MDTENVNYYDLPKGTKIIDDKNLWTIGTETE
jgi:hypothetical protein